MAAKDRLSSTSASRAHIGRGDVPGREAGSRLATAALAAAANAVFITDVNGVIEWVNDAFTRMTGYPAETAVGNTPRLLKSGRQPREFYRNLWDTILAGDVWHGRVVNRDAHGRIYTVLQTVTPVRRDDGEVEHFVAVHEDITEVLDATREVEATRERLEALFDSTLDAMLMVDTDGHCLDANPAALELFGCTLDDMVRLWPTTFVPDPQPDVIEMPLSGPTREGAAAGVLTIRRLDGALLETEFRAVSNIQPDLHLLVLRDVTTRNDYVRRLREGERQFRQLAENATDIVARLRIDPAEGMLVDYANPAAASILGYPLERILGDPELMSMLIEDDRLRHEIEVALPNEHEPVASTTVPVRHADGSTVWLEINAATMEDPESPSAFQIVARDVTARRETIRALQDAIRDQAAAAEELERVNVLRDTFLRSVSHEVRTPLTTIIGASQMLVDQAVQLDPDVVPRIHEVILSGARRIEQLMEDLQDVDGFVRGHLVPSPAQTDLAALVHDAIDTIDVHDHHVTLAVEPSVMVVDRVWFRRIVERLLENVVKHTPAGTRAELLLERTTQGVRLVITDDGPGIAAEERARLLEPFEQGATASSSPSPGTGIGLSVVRAFARMHGGDVILAESPTGGTRVEVTLQDLGNEGASGET